MPSHQRLVKGRGICRAEARRTIRFVLVLVGGIAVLTWVATHFVETTTRTWFERDIALRAQLAISGSQRALVSHWIGGDWSSLRQVLTDIADDERIMAVAACGSDRGLLTATAGSAPRGVQPLAPGPRHDRS